MEVGGSSPRSGSNKGVLSVDCLNCGNKTKNPKFCGKSCSASYNNRITPKRKLKKLCSKSGCLSIVRNYRSLLCEPHYGEYKDSYRFTEVGEYRNKLSVKDKHPSWANAHIRGFARSWLKHLTVLPCKNCGYSKHVELCHIKPVSSYPDTATLSEINDESNVIQLCRNCHWEFDNNLLSLSEIVN